MHWASMASFHGHESALGVKAESCWGPLMVFAGFALLCAAEASCRKLKCQ
jgi:hypothetical protein